MKVSLRAIQIPLSSDCYITGLPWRKVSDKNEVLKVKEECRTKHRDKLLRSFKCKEEFGKIMDYVDSLHYEDRVDYSYIYEMLKTVSLLNFFLDLMP